jgi:hypothetical protein
VLATLAPGEKLSRTVAGEFEQLSKKKTKQIRVYEDVAAMVDRLASLQDPPKSVPEFLSEFLRPLLKKELAKALDRAKKQLAGEDE